MAENEKNEKKMVAEHPMDGHMPVTYTDKYGLAKLLVKSGMIPKGLNTPEKVFVALQMGHEYGLSPMIACNNITAINGRAVMSADLIVALCRRHPDFAGMSIESSPTGCTVTMRRRRPDAREDIFRATFAEEDAKKAGLLAKEGPWQQYPQRMYQARAKAFCGRDAFPDVVAGILAVEEARDMEGGVPPDGEPRDVTPETQVDPNEAIRTEIAELLKHECFSPQNRQVYGAAVARCTTPETLAKLKAQIEKIRTERTPKEAAPPTDRVESPAGQGELDLPAESAEIW